MWTLSQNRYRSAAFLENFLIHLYVLIGRILDIELDGSLFHDPGQNLIPERLVPPPELHGLGKSEEQSVFVEFFEHKTASIYTVE